jgi:hypothetical protein
MAVIQSRSQALTGIIGARRAWTVSMISPLSMPCAWSATGVESRHRRRRSPSTGTVKQKLRDDPSSGSWNEPDYRRQATRGRPRPDRRAIASDTEQRSRSIRDQYRACLDATLSRRLVGPAGALLCFVRS